MGIATCVVLAASGVRKYLDVLRTTGATVTPAGESWLDVTGPGVTKATALEALRAKLDIPQETTVAVGDSENDLEALTWASRGISMGHAPASVRGAADEVTGTIDEHGVATALDSFLPGCDTATLSNLAAQLAIAVESAPAVAKLQVRHGLGLTAGLEGVAIRTAIARNWLQHAPIPAAGGATMQDLTDAADQAGLAYPTTDLGLRARWMAAETDGGQIAYELALWPSRNLRPDTPIRP